MNTSRAFDNLPFQKQKLIMRKKGVDFKHYCNAKTLDGNDCNNRSVKYWGYCKIHSEKDKNGCDKI